MIQICSTAPDHFHFFYETAEEEAFIKLYADKVIDDFINHRTNGRFHNRKELLKEATNARDPIDIMVFDERSKNLAWNLKLIRKLEDFTNEQFKQFKLEVNE